MASKKLTKVDCNKIFKRVIRLIETSDLKFFKLKKLKGIMGYCEWENGIGLDYRRELIPTLVHECIHFLYPKWSETQVLYAEKRVINSATIKQVIKLIKVFSDKLA